MSYIESINAELRRLQNADAALRNDYELNVAASNKAYEQARQDEYYAGLEDFYLKLRSTVNTLIKSVKSGIMNLPNPYSIKEYDGTADVAGKIAQLGFLDYSVKLLEKCNSESAKITPQSTPEEDIKAIEKLSEYYAEINAVLQRFDEFYYAHIRTKKMEQAASDEHDEDLDKLKTELNNGLDNVYNTAMTAIKAYRATYQQITDRFAEERFAAQIGKQHTAFPKKICLGGIFHPIEDYRRDIVAKALSCGNVVNLAVVFEMPLVGNFDDYDADLPVKSESTADGNIGADEVIDPKQASDTVYAMTMELLAHMAEE